jgi:FkbM family methyltransferase
VENWGCGGFVPHIHKDFKEKSLIPRSLLRGFFIQELIMNQQNAINNKWGLYKWAKALWLKIMPYFIIENMGYIFVKYRGLHLRQHILRSLSDELFNSEYIGFVKKHLFSLPSVALLKMFLVEQNDDKYIDILGAKLPDITNDAKLMKSLMLIFIDTFLIRCFFNDNYNKETVEILDKHMCDGPYGYNDGSFDVTVKTGDVVIDAGAWIGDFSAYAASKGAFVYSFEPSGTNFRYLTRTAELNKGIIPINKGLGNSCEEIFIEDNSTVTSTIIRDSGGEGDRVNLTTIDKFVEEKNIKSLDFIKADIEGAEREMLKGAKNTLRKFSPKIAICTYHLHDDPFVLEKLIIDANPGYKVAHLRGKLFAAV